MTAAYLARHISDEQLRSNPLAIENAVIGTDPEYAAIIGRLAADNSAAVADLRRSEIARLRETDPTAARDLVRSARPPIFVILSTLATAGGFAIYFSRADLDLEVFTPVSMGFLASGALFFAVAMLPAGRDNPPITGAAGTGVLLSLLSGITTGFGWYVAASARFDTLPWLTLGVASTVAMLLTVVVVAWASRRVPISDPAERKARIAMFPEELRSAVASRSVAAQEAVRAAHSARPESARAEMTAAAREAADALQERGLDHRFSDPPGTAVVQHAVRRAAAQIGVAP